jgi:hypothetical protein
VASDLPLGPAPAGAPASGEADGSEGLPTRPRPLSVPPPRPRDEGPPPTALRRPLPPLGTPPPTRAPVEFATDPQVGRIAKLDVDTTSFAYVMTGNPRIVGEDFSIRAQTIVAWLDKAEAPDLGGGLGLIDLGPKEEAGAPAGPAGERPRARATVLGGGPAGSAIPKALLGIYAEGAVELVSVELTFRSDALYIDPRTSHALLIEPRFESNVALRSVSDPVPVFVRAQEARIVAPGVAVFDTAEVTTSRANDRVLLKVARLTVGSPARRVRPLLMASVRSARSGSRPSRSRAASRRARARLEGGVLRRRAATSPASGRGRRRPHPSAATPWSASGARG